MGCSQPPPLSDDQLSAALDGVAGQAVLDHLDYCAECAARLAQARTLERRLGARLRRWDCPPPQQIGDYHLGLLEPEARQAIALHLEQCALCTAELAELRAFLPAESAPQAPVRTPTLTPRVYLGEILAHVLPAAPVLALRGAAPRVITAVAGATTIMLEARPVGSGYVVLAGQVVDDDLDRWTGALVELRQGGALEATAAVDDLGGFACGPLPPLAAELRVTPENGPSVVVPEIALQE